MSETGTLTIRPAPEHVRWESGEKMGGPGIYVESDQYGKGFVSWEILKPELEKELLIQLGRVLGDRVCTLQTAGFHGRKNWLVHIMGENGEELGSLWLGGDPDNNWRWDGLVRAGNASNNHQAVVWQVFQRYSDGSYRRIAAYDKPEHRIPTEQK